MLLLFSCLLPFVLVSLCITLNLRSSAVCHAPSISDGNSVQVEPDRRAMFGRSFYCLVLKI